MKTASLASIPSRIPQLQKTIESLLPQMDRINVFLNNYTTVPDFLNNEKIQLEFGDNSLGDAGKFFWANTTHDYHFICDDDIIYAPDYADKMIKKIDKYGRMAVIGVHGINLRFTPITDYNSSTERFSFHSALENDTLVHILGTGTIAYYGQAIKVSLNDFKEKNMADIFFALLGQNQKVSFISIEREKRWLVQQKTPNSIFSEMSSSINSIMKYINGITWRKFDYFGLCSEEEKKDRLIESIRNSHTHTWDILIPSLEVRKKTYERLVRTLTRQIDNLGLMNQVKIISWIDDGKLSIGYKSNQLIENSTAKYVNRFDDDDMPHDDYIRDIWVALQQNPDCVTFNGKVTFNTINEQEFNAHISNKEYKNENRKFLRPPCHLCPTKREIAVFYKFKELDKARDRSSDVIRTLEMMRARALTKVIHIDKPLYFYNRRI